MNDELYAIVEQLRANGASDDEIALAIEQYDNTGVVSNDSLGKTSPLPDTPTEEKPVEDVNNISNQSSDSDSSDSTSVSHIRGAENVALTNEDWEQIEIMQNNGDSDAAITNFITSRQNSRLTSAVNQQHSEKIEDYLDGESSELEWLDEYGDDLKDDALQLYAEGHSRAEIYSIMEGKFYENQDNFIVEKISTYAQENGGDVPQWAYEILQTPANERTSDWWDNYYKEHSGEFSAFGPSGELWRTILEHDYETYNTGYHTLSGRNVDIQRGLPEEVYVLPKEHWSEANKILAEDGYDGLVQYVYNLAEEDERIEEALVGTYSNPLFAAIGLDNAEIKNVFDAYGNVSQTVRSAYPNLRLTSSRLARLIFGDERIDRFVEEHGENTFWTEGLSDQNTIDDARVINLLNSSNRDTEGILENILEGDLGGTLAAIASAPSHAASSFINMIQTAGGSIFSDIFSEMYFAVNEARAEMAGVTVEDLIRSGNDDVGISTLFAVPAAALEFVGLKGQAKGLYKTFLNKKSLKYLMGAYLKSNAGEGLTEILQYGLTETAVEYEKTKDVWSATKRFFTSMASEEGVENFLQGFFATGAVGPVTVGGPLLQGYLRDSKNRKAINETLGEIAALETKKEGVDGRTKEGKQLKKDLTASQKRLEKQLRDLYVEPHAALENAPKENIPAIEKKLEEIKKIAKENQRLEENDSVGEKTLETSKKANQKAIDNLQKEILELAEPKKTQEYGGLTDVETNALYKTPEKLTEVGLTALKKRVEAIKKQIDKATKVNARVLKKASKEELNANRQELTDARNELRKAETQIEKVETARKAQEAKIQKEREARLEKEGVKVEKTAQEVALEGIEQDSSNLKKTEPKKKSNKRKAPAKPKKKSKAKIQKTPAQLKKASPTYSKTFDELEEGSRRSDKETLTELKKELKEREGTKKGTKRIKERIERMEKDIDNRTKSRVGKRYVAEKTVDVTNNPKNKSNIKKLANALVSHADGIRDFIALRNDEATTNGVIDEIKDIISNRDDLTKTQKAKLIEDLDTSEVKNEVKEQRKQERKEIVKETQPKTRKKPDTEESHIDSPEVAQFDDLTHQEDVDIEIESFKESVVSKVDNRKDVPVKDNKQDEIDAVEADNIYQEFIRALERSASGIIKRWSNSNTGVKKHIRKLSPRSLYSLVAEGLTGTAYEDVRVDSTPSTKLLTRMGGIVYNRLKAIGEDVSEFHKLPPQIQEILDRSGLPDTEIERRALAFNFIRAGGAMMELVADANGFLEYRRGYPPRTVVDPNTGKKKVVGRVQDMKMVITDLSTLDDLGISDQLLVLKRKGIIKMPKDWRTMSGPVPLTVVNKKGFRDGFGEGVDGYTVFQTLLEEGNAIGKEQDWYDTEATTIKVSDLKKMNLFLRGATLNEMKVSDKDAKSRVPQLKRPKAWTSFLHATGLSAISNISPEARKKIANATKALKTLTNASSQSFTIDKRTYEVFSYFQEELYSYDDKNYETKVKEIKVDEFGTIQDMAKQLIGQTFYALHNFDWRGRLYNSVKFLNFQGNKVAKALYRFGTKKAIGKQGFANLVKQLGDYLGADIVLTDDGSFELYDSKKHKAEDKVSSKMMTDKDRFRLGMHLVTKLANIAADPKKHRDEAIAIFKAAGDREDLIALSSEMLLLVEHVRAGGTVETFESNFILWNDATVSGAQNLAMLTLDPVTLALVNGLDSYQKRDLYIKVGDKVFNAIPKRKWTDDDSKELKTHLVEINRLQALIDNPWSRDKEGKATNDVKKHKANLAEYIESPEFVSIAERYWGDESRRNKVRKLAKGPVMTGFYSAGPDVMADDMVKDFRPEDNFGEINKGLALYLTTRLKKATAEIAPGPKLAQSTFTSIANAIMDQGELLQLKGMINDFPFIQEYLYFDQLRDETGKKIDYSAEIKNPGMVSLRFGADISSKVKLGIHSPDLNKGRIAAAPNITHFLDSQVIASQFTDKAVADRSVATIHDNFGTHAVDANAQVQSVLDNMADIYKVDGKSKPMHRLIDNAVSASRVPDKVGEKLKQKYDEERAERGEEANPDEIRNNRYAISSAGGVKRYNGWTPRTTEEAQLEAQLEERLLKQEGTQKGVENKADDVQEEGKGCAIG